MSLIFQLPQNLLELVRGHWLLERLADMNLVLDPAKIKSIFNATINEMSLISYLIMRGRWYALPDATKEAEHPKKYGAKIVYAYEKAITAFQKVTDDKTIPEGTRNILLRKVAELEGEKDFFGRSTGIVPISKSKIESVSLNQIISTQAYLLFKVIKPLVDAYNKEGKEITDSNIHVFIADFLAAVYKGLLNVEELNALKIKNMIKDIRKTPSKKKLATLHRIIE